MSSVRKLSKSDCKVIVRMDPVLKEWLKWYARNNNTTITKIVTDHIRNLKKFFEEGGEDNIPQV
jgi:hypothetical protein